MRLDSYKFVYNAAAHFAAAEKYPEGLIVEINKPGRPAFDAICWSLAETAKQGELTRRHMGEDAKKVPTEEDFKIKLKAGQIREAAELLMKTIIKGLSKEEDEDKEVDEVLQELQKKTSED